VLNIENLNTIPETIQTKSHTLIKTDLIDRLSLNIKFDKNIFVVQPLTIYIFNLCIKQMNYKLIKTCKIHSNKMDKVCEYDLKKRFLENDNYMYRFHDIQNYFNGTMHPGCKQTVSILRNGPLCSNLIMCVEMLDDLTTIGESLGVNLTHINININQNQNQNQNQNMLRNVVKNFIKEIRLEIGGEIIDEINFVNLYELICLNNLLHELKFVKKSNKYILLIPLPFDLFCNNLVPLILLYFHEIRLTVLYQESHKNINLNCDASLMVRYYYPRKYDSINIQEMFIGQMKLFETNAIDINIAQHDICKEIQIKNSIQYIKINITTHNLSQIYFYLYDKKSCTYIYDVIDKVYIRDKIYDAKKLFNKTSQIYILDVKNLMDCISFYGEIIISYYEINPSPDSAFVLYCFTSNDNCLQIEKGCANKQY